MKLLKFLLSWLFFLLLGGCASLISTTPLRNTFCGAISGEGSGDCSAWRNKVFVGTRDDIWAVGDFPGAWKILPVIDTPLSLGMDTIFLPYTLIDAAVH